MAQKAPSAPGEWIAATIVIIRTNRNRPTNPTEPIDRIDPDDPQIAIQ